MKYFINFEFHEGNIPQQIKGINIPKWLSKPLPNIQMISVGIVSEEIPTKQYNIEGDGYEIKGNTIKREYYAISKDFNLKAAWNNEWVRENVLKSIHEELNTKLIIDKNTKDILTTFPLKSYKGNKLFNEFKKLINKYGKTNKKIAEEIINFTIHRNITQENLVKVGTNQEVNWDTSDIEFYGYNSDYDWVIFCQLFGTMMDLPSGFPMYCIDLKQTLDEKILNNSNLEVNDGLGNKVKIPNTKNKIEIIKNLSDYPKQTNEHNALANAHFNYNLYKFLNTL